MRNQRDVLADHLGDPCIVCTSRERGLSLGQIKPSTLRDIDPNDNPDQRFFVTRLGCGIAGYTKDQISPLFADAPPNCLLPEGWRK